MFVNTEIKRNNNVGMQNARDFYDILCSHSFKLLTQTTFFSDDPDTFKNEYYIFSRFQDI